MKNIKHFYRFGVLLKHNMNYVAFYALCVLVYEKGDKMKKTISIILCIATLFCVITAGGVTASAKTYTSSNYKYVVLKSGNVKITRYTGAETTVVTPYVIDGKKVSAIGDNAFAYHSSIESLTVSEGVCTLGNETFNGCSGLKSITLPNSITKLSSLAFEGCVALQNIHLGNKIKYLHANGFKDTALYTDKTHWDDGALYIGNYLIKVNEDYKGSCSVKDGTVIVAANAFDGCKGLTSLVLPASLKYFIQSDDERFSKLKNVYVDNKNPYLTDKKGVLFNKKQTKLILYPQGRKKREYKIPKTVRTVGKYAFQFARLRKIFIGNRVKTVEAGAFRYSKLKKLRLGKSVIKIGNRAFSDCMRMKSVSIPKNVKHIGADAFGTYTTEEYDCRSVKGFFVCGYRGTAAQEYSFGSETQGHDPFEFTALNYSAPKVKASVKKAKVIVNYSTAFEAEGYQFVIESKDNTIKKTFNGSKGGSKSFTLEKGVYKIKVRAFTEGSINYAHKPVYDKHKQRVFSKWSKPLTVVIE